MAEETKKITIADMESKNLAAGAGPSFNSNQAQSAAGKNTPSAPDLSDQYLFYNVMPKAGSQSKDLVSATLKVEEPKDQNPPANGTAGSASPGFFKRYRLLIIILTFLLIVGVAAYFVMIKLTSVKPESILNENILNQASSTPSTQQATSTDPQLLTWQQNYFGNNCIPSMCADDSDPDHDGLTNKEEYNLKTDPNNNDSDQDGISDGDEVHIFGSSPINSHTSKDPKYSDLDYIKGGYDFKTGNNLTPFQISSITVKIKQLGLHEPTIKNLSDALLTIYKYSDSTTTPPATPAPASNTPISGFDNSVEAQQGRDAQRSATIENIGIALIKYRQDTGIYPNTDSFTDMFNSVRPYLKVATRPDDPINKDPYVYGYQLVGEGSDYTLSFFSEVAGQIIKKHAADAQKDMSDEQASIYDDQRRNDLQMIQTALLLYSNKNVAGNQNYVFPTVQKYKTELVPNYIEQLPKDPKTGQDYQYQVSSTFDTFTIKGVLDNPSAGTTGYMCNQDGCQNY